MSSPSTVTSDRARAELARREQERRHAAQDPAWFLDHVSMVDEGEFGEVNEFRFHLNDPTSGWYWQRSALDELHEHKSVIWLKARQIGLTWLAAGYGNLWVPLYHPGATTLIYRQKESDAADVVKRVWQMWLSLPDHLRNGATVIKPARGAEPSTEIEWKFPNGRISKTIGMTAVASAGHGRTVAFVLLDEFARIDDAREILKAASPAVEKGKMAIVSTANGLANLDTGEGSYFHYAYENAKAMGFRRRFFGWRVHPDRDDHWYETSEAVRRLAPHERAEQYPETPDDAFTHTQRVFFDIESLEAYSSAKAPRPHLRDPLYSMDFELHAKPDGSPDPTKARIDRRPDGRINVYREPEEDHRYGIGADAATARGRDFSAAYVIDLADRALVAEFHGKLDPDRYATQLHFLGKWYGGAWLAIEMGGGYGDAVQNPLRDGKDGRPPYPKLWRHQLDSRTDQPYTKVFGYPMTTKTRPQATGYAKTLVRELAFPWLTRDLFSEMRHFVEHETGTTPAAQPGTTDDRIMAFCVTCEIYRRRGHHPARAQRGKQKPYTPSYPWQPAADEGNKHVRSKFDDGAGRPVDRDGHAITRRRTRARRPARGPG